MRVCVVNLSQLFLSPLLGWFSESPTSRLSTSNPGPFRAATPTHLLSSPSSWKRSSQCNRDECCRRIRTGSCKRRLNQMDNRRWSGNSARRNIVRRRGRWRFLLAGRRSSLRNSLLRRVRSRRGRGTGLVRVIDRGSSTAGAKPRGRQLYIIASCNKRERPVIKIYMFLDFNRIWRLDCCLFCIPRK